MKKYVVYVETWKDVGVKEIFDTEKEAKEYTDMYWDCWLAPDEAIWYEEEEVED